MSIKERPVGGRLRELETFGRRLAETQALSGDAHIDWVVYGRAAQEALRRGHGIPLVGPFVAAQRPPDVTGARLQPGRKSPRPVPIRTPSVPGYQPVPRQRRVVRLAASTDVSRDWLYRLRGSAAADRRILSTAWCVRVGAGTSWRVALVLLTLSLGAAGVQAVDTALLVASASILLPNVVRDRGISLLRWSLLGAFIMRALATASFSYVLVAALMVAPVAAILAARRWRLA